VKSAVQRVSQLTLVGERLLPAGVLAVELGPRVADLDRTDVVVAVELDRGREPRPDPHDRG
jgi:hypothetical protein